MTDSVKLTTMPNGDRELAFTRPDDTGTDKTTTVYFTAASWAQFMTMMQSATAVPSADAP